MNEEFLTEIKRLVADPAAGPRLNDLLNAEAGRLIAALAGDEFDPAVPPSNEGVIDRLDRYTALTADLAGGVGLGARWSGDAVRPLWPSLIERVVAAVDRARGQTIWADLSLYPGVLLLYASGVGALAGGRYDNLRAILLEPRLQYHNEWRRAVELLYPVAVLDDRQAARIAGIPKTFAPMSDKVAADLRPLVADLVPDDGAFGRLFDRFEYLLGLIYVDVTENAWGPTGRFVTDQTGAGIDRLIEPEISEAGASWAPLAAGLFGGSSARLQESLGRWRRHVGEVRTQARFYRTR
jgi:hypothetical protein